MTFWTEQEERQRLTDLRDAVHEVGLRRRVATREQIIHELAPKLFGRYVSSEYAKVIRELVTAGLIDRPTPTGIKPREEPRFIEPDQGSRLSRAIS